MPTIPPEPPRLSERQPHQHRETAQSFGTDAERYDRARPRYPDSLIDRIVAGRPGLDVLDVGSGTGIAARQFQAAGCRVLGVEPDARMAGLAQQSGGEVDVATFEDWEPDGRAFDAVVAGQAWHWIDPVAGAVKAARVLRPGGLLAPFWNAFRLPPGLAQSVADVCRRALPEAPFDFEAIMKETLSGYQALFAKAADGIRAAGGYGEPEQWRFDWERSCTRDAWLEQMPTQAIFTRLPPDKLQEVLQGVGAAIDAMGGSFTMGYTTVAVTAVRTGAS
ncbi:class I SAM-dependent methyltransferase [Streptomyces sp. SCA3-4]|uniref:class I SAM-dependent methyltransferase n=1 Tax=Streptomyces sichuanensis TaxID=2871810 RepID=UPI001CE35DAF|nr:class I SAM-dependent methyltransferase [Streptomyces sichuanensis]MCA6092020.1 class I SAM-dependent methyltransferase [Streptomyces sichuanensis]